MLFDIAPSEFLLTALVAVVVIGPKDMPRALRTAGRWMGKMRRVSNHFRSGIETMIREAELEEMEKKWRDQNAAIMQTHPDAAAPGAEAHPVPGEVLASSHGLEHHEVASVDAPHSMLPAPAPAPALPAEAPGHGPA